MTPTNVKTETLPRTAKNGLIGLFHSWGLWFLGLCCGNVWIGWMNGAHGISSDSLWDVICAATMIVTLLVGILYGWRRGDRVCFTYKADWPIAIIMCIFTLPAAGFINFSNLQADSVLLICSTIATEVGMAWLFIRWGVFLSRLNLRATIGCIFGAHVVGCTAKLLLYYIPTEISAIPVALLPLFSMLSLTFLAKRLNNAKAAEPEALSCSVMGPNMVWCSGKRGQWGPLWKVAIFIFCYRIIFQLIGFDEPYMSRSLSTICCVAEIIVSLVIIYMLFIKSGSFTFQQVWSIFLLLLGFVLLCALSSALSAWGVSMLAAVGSLLVMFIWLVFADISHHSTLHPFVIFGVARISYELPRLLVEGLDLGGVPVPFGDTFFTCILFFVLLIFALLFFDLRDPTLALIFSDFQKRENEQSPGQIREICHNAALEHSLTQREEEILFYLCQGRTRAYIAETLYLSQNTVRGHTQRIYSKLGVHNKTELQRLLGI